MQITLRPACIQDLDFCSNLYFAGMERIIRELKLDPVDQASGFREQWEAAQVRIVVLNGVDVGWLQTTVRDNALFLGQLFVSSALQNQGIGTQVIHRLIAEAGRSHRAVTLGVAKINPALRLYQRLGFRVTHEDDRKYYMRRDPGAEPPITT